MKKAIMFLFSNIIPLGIDKYLYVIFFVVPILIISCSSSKQAEEKSFDIRDVISSINRTGEKIRSLKGSGNISLESESGGNSGNFKINILKPDSLHLSITGPFGINVAKAFIARDTFLFHDAFNNVAVTGKTNKKNLNEILRVNIEFDDIMGVASGAPDFTREKDASPQVDQKFEENESVLIYKNEGDIIKYYVNLENKYISKRVVYSGSGKIVKEERYQNYYKKDDMWLPRSIQVSLPSDNQSLSLYYERQDINSGDLNFSISIPKDTKVLHWR